MYEVLERVVHDTSGQFSNGDVTDRPCCTVTTTPHFRVEFHLTDTLPVAPEEDMTKPAYRVPLMSEMNAEPRSGYKVASTFSGGGGSCTGYHMAGFEVAYANEFIPAAQDTYRANHPRTHLDTRDIRAVTPESIFSALGIERGELDLLDGSPPCSAFSTAGKRHEVWGKKKDYSDSAYQVVDDLFFEYTRLLRGLQPKVFVAENVSGLIKGSAKGYFKAILADMKASGYRVEARLLNAAWLGVPQARERLIFVGVREDLNLSPAFPKPLAYQYTVRDALPWILEVGSIRDSGFIAGNVFTADRPNATVMAGGAGGANSSQFGVVRERALSPNTAEKLEYVSIDGYAIAAKYDALRQGQRVFYGGPLTRAHADRPSPTVTATAGVNTSNVVHPTERRKFTIRELKRICAFPDDYELTGSYAQQWERLGRSVPPVMMNHIARAIRTEILDRAR